MSSMQNRLLLVSSDLALSQRILQFLEVSRQPVFEVTVSQGIKDASRKITKKCFDLILMDISLTNDQGEQGFETLQTLAPSAIFIVLYDKNDMSILHKLVDKGVNDCVDQSHLNRVLLERVIHYNLASRHVNNLLKVSTATFKAIGDACPQGVMVSDLSGCITYTNTAYQKLTGMVAKQLLGSPWIESIYSQDRLRMQREWRQVVQTQVPFCTKVRVLGKNHTVHFVLVNGAFLYDSKELYGHVRIMEDITPNGVAVDTSEKDENDSEQLKCRQTIKSETFLDYTPLI